MKEAVTEVQEIIEDSVLSDKISKIYLNTIDEDDYNADKTVILIQDVNADTAIYGNNKIYGITRKIEVQIFFSNIFQGSYVETEVELIREMKQKHWLMSDTYTVDVDPQENIRYSTFYFVKNQEIDF